MKALLIRTSLVLFLTIAATYPASAKSIYIDTVIQGWTIKVNSELVSDHKGMATSILSILDAQLKSAIFLLPTASLDQLRKAQIWVEVSSVNKAPIQYHFSAGWLKDHGQDPAKQNCIEISAPEYLKNGTVGDVMQQLGFAYYARVIGAQNTDVLAAYGLMMSNHLYSENSAIKVDAATYFAVLSSEYFMATSSDVRSELKKRDMAGIAMVEKCWLKK